LLERRLRIARWVEHIAQGDCAVREDLAPALAPRRGIDVYHSDCIFLRCSRSLLTLGLACCRLQPGGRSIALPKDPARTEGVFEHHAVLQDIVGRLRALGLDDFLWLG